MTEPRTIDLTIQENTGRLRALANRRADPQRMFGIAQTYGLTHSTSGDVSPGGRAMFDLRPMTMPIAYIDREAFPATAFEHHKGIGTQRMGALTVDVGHGRCLSAVWRTPRADGCANVSSKASAGSR
jgi:hypothetical protein